MLQINEVLINVTKIRIRYYYFSLKSYYDFTTI